MRKILSLFLVVMIVFTSFPMPAEASFSSLQVDKTTAKVGETVTVSYVIPNAIQPANFDVEIGFDNTKLEATSVNWKTIANFDAPLAADLPSINANGTLGASWLATNSSNTQTAANMNLVTATFQVKAGATPGNINFTVNSLTVANEIAGDMVAASGATSDPLTVTIVSEITGAINVTGIDTPTKGGTPDPTATAPTNTTVGAVTWSPAVSGTFAATTAYTAEVTVTPDSGYTFANGATYQINGNTATVTDAGSGAKTLTYTFPATADKTLTALAIVGDAAATVSPQDTVTVALTAKGTYDDLSEVASETGVTWGVTSPATGVTVNNGTVSIDDTVSGAVVITASKGGIDATDHTITVTRPAPALATMTISGATTLAVPTYGTTTLETYTVTGVDQYGDPFTPSSPTWTIVAPTPTGVKIVSDTVEVSPTASAGNITVKVVSDGKEQTYSVSITKAASVVTTIEVAGGFGAIDVPTVAAGGTISGAAFTATVKDQFGDVMTGQSVTWSLDAPTPTGVSIDQSGVVTVTSDADASSQIYVSATAGNHQDKTKSFIITKDTPEVAKVTVTGDATIVIPSSGSGTPKTYTATFTDQYGKPIGGAPTWGTSGTLPTGVSVLGDSVTVAAGADTGKFKITAEANGITGEFEITVSEKLLSTISNFADTTVVYGQGYTPAATADHGAISYSYSDSLTKIDSTTAVGSYQVTAEAVSDTHYGKTIITVTVAQKPLTWGAAGTVQNKIYDGDADAIVSIQPTLSGIINSDDVSADGSGATIKFADANAGNGKNVTATGYTIQGTDMSNYTAPTGHPTFNKANISKRAITVKADDVPGHVYGTAVSTPTAFTVTSTGDNVLQGSDSNSALGVTLKTTATATSDVGSYPITGTATSTNYAVTVNDGTFTIVQAPRANETASTTVKTGTTGAEFNLSAWSGLTGVSIVYKAHDNAVVADTPTVSGGKVTYDVAASAALGNHADAITLTVQSKNYSDFDVTIDVNVTDKEVPTLQVSDVAVTHTGTALTLADLTKGAKAMGIDGTTEVEGTWAIVTIAPNLTDINLGGVPVALEFTPTGADAATYVAAQTTIRVTIKPVPVTPPPITGGGSGGGSGHSSSAWYPTGGSYGIGGGSGSAGGTAFGIVGAPSQATFTQILDEATTTAIIEGGSTTINVVGVGPTGIIVKLDPDVLSGLSGLRINNSIANITLSATQIANIISQADGDTVLITLKSTFGAMPEYTITISAGNRVIGL